MKTYLLLLGVLLLQAGYAAGQKSQASQVHLREHVVITGETIRLSDLLPAAASAALQKAAASLELGRAPLPGSIRRLTQEQISARLVEADEILRQLAIPAQAIVERTGWPIETNLIMTAVGDFLDQRGWEQTDKTTGSVEWSDGVAARRESPKLEVMGVRMNPSLNTLEARLRCADKSMCANFLVRIALVGGKKMAGAASQATLISVAKRRGLQASSNLNPGLVKRGAPAQLTMESSGMRILLPVICLQAGDMGDQVLVRTEGRQVFSAQVVAAGQLRTTF